jgi:hypothetical protein
MCDFFIEYRSKFSLVKAIVDDNVALQTIVDECVNKKFEIVNVVQPAGEVEIIREDKLIDPKELDSYFAHYEIPRSEKPDFILWLAENRNEVEDSYNESDVSLAIDLGEALCIAYCTHMSDRDRKHQCDYCVATMINGVYCHETGCPKQTGV